MNVYLTDPPHSREDEAYEQGYKEGERDAEAAQEALLDQLDEARGEVADLRTDLAELIASRERLRAWVFTSIASHAYWRQQGCKWAGDMDVKADAWLAARDALTPADLEPWPEEAAYD